MNASRCASAIVMLLGLSNLASASPLFARAVKEKYGFTSVSCFTCHMKGVDAAGQRFGKDVRNEFGKLFATQLEGKMIVARMAKSKAAKEAQFAAEEAGNAQQAQKFEAEAQQIDDAIIKDFLEALGKVESQKAADGKTYGAKFNAREIEGVK
jgi:hypothetical protein